MPVSGAANIQSYPVLDRATATLTMREKEADPRVAVPAGDWELAKAKETDGKVELTPSNTDLYIKSGFKTGWIYELIYDTEGSRVMGLGFLGLRDLVSFLAPWQCGFRRRGESARWLYRQSLWLRRFSRRPGGA